MPAGSYTPAGATVAQADLPAFCVVKGEATPTADSLIRFEVWVPQGSAWNGKLVATGNGGSAAPDPSAQNDLLMALDRWVEQGTAPERLIAARLANGVVAQTRPLCAHPKRAVYSGAGSTDDAASFVCR